jgi:Tol biopolymer transport system component
MNALQLAAFAPIALSPDGELAAYTIQEPRRMVTDGDERYRSYDRRGNSLFGVGCDIWLTDTRNGQTRKLTDGKSSHYYPVWSPDGRSLAFYSDRDGAARLWIWDRGGNRFRRASDRIIRPLGGQVARWSPDGKRILFPVLPEGMSIEQAADLSASEKPAAARKAPDAPTVTVFDGAEGKGAGTAWSLKSMVEDVASVDVASGAVRVVAHGLHPFWFQFSPDGATIAVSSLDSYGDGTVFQPTYDLLAFDASTAVSRVLVAGVPQAAGNQASFSPDGKSIAYCSGGDSPEAKRGDCFSVPTAGGSARLLTPGEHPPFWSYAYREPRWEPSGAAVYLFGEGELWKAAADGGGARPLV